MSVNDIPKLRDPVRIAKEETLGKHPSVTCGIIPSPGPTVASSAQSLRTSTGPLTRSKIQPALRHVSSAGVGPMRKLRRNTLTHQLLTCFVHICPGASQDL